MRPSRDSNSTAYPDRIFYAGRWRTPEQIEKQRSWRRTSALRHPAPRALRTGSQGYIDQHGYRVLTVRPGHPCADARGKAYAHRIVMWMVVGRRLLPTERVHHVDENKLNNSPSNLWLWPTNAAHTAWHSMQKYGHELQVHMPAVPLPLRPTAVSS